MQSAAKDCGVALELGGSDPMIVCDDADLDEPSAPHPLGRFLTAVRPVLAVKRLYLFDNIADPFMEKLVEKAKKMTSETALNPAY